MRYCQTGEQEIIDALIEQTNPPRSCVEFGAGDGYRFSNTRHLIERGWQGLMMDADPKGSVEVREHFITPENICGLLTQYDVPRDFGLLSIDMDGQDYWVLQSLLREFAPRIIVAEYNASIPLAPPVTVPCDPKIVWTQTDYYGCSFAALAQLLSPAYEYVTQCSNLNTFWVTKGQKVAVDRVDPVHYHYWPVDPRPWHRL